MSLPQCGVGSTGGRGVSQALLLSGGPLVELLPCTSRDRVSSHLGQGSLASLELQKATLKSIERQGFLLRLFP